MNTLTTILVSGGGFAVVASIITAIATLSHNRADAVKLLNEAQRIAQITALESADHRYSELEKSSDHRYGELEKSCNKCLDELGDLRRHLKKRDKVEDALLDALVEVVPLLDASAESTLALRAAIRTVRQARYDYVDE